MIDMNRNVNVLIYNFGLNRNKTLDEKHMH